MIATRVHFFTPPLHRYDFKYLDAEVVYLTRLERHAFLAFYDAHFGERTRTLLAVWVHCNPVALPATSAATGADISGSSDSSSDGTGATVVPIEDWVAVATSTISGSGTVLGPDADLAAFQAARKWFNRGSRTSA